MKALKYGIDTSWLDLGIDEDKIFNPMTDFIFKDTDENKIVERLCYIMSQPEYFYFTAKYVLNIELFPMQLVFLQELWEKKYPMIVASRGASKSFSLAVYSILRALLMPNRKIVVVGAAFRQSKVIFGYMESIWNNAPILRDLCDSRSGLVKSVDSFVVKINNSTITCLPLGDGEKIRGQRAHDVIADEMASIPRDIFERVVAGFTTVAANPVEKIKMRSRMSLNQEVEEQDTYFKDNQIVLSGTAYYDFNHFADYWKKHKSFIESRGNQKYLAEIMGGAPEEGFKWDDYTILRVPVSHLPPGLMDDGIIARARATVHSGIYSMEYGACFSNDSQGFFKRSLVQSCVVDREGGDDPIVIDGEDIFFEGALRGDLNKKYVYGVDPASEIDNFSVVILEVNDSHRKVVYCWTTNRKKHKERVKVGDASETDYYSYCSRKIRDLMKVFPCQEIALDSQGGGIAIMEALHDKDKIKEGEHPIWPIIDPDKPEDTDDMHGLHILNMCNFAKYDWLRDANHGLRKDLEDKLILFPYFDSVSLGIAGEMDNISNNLSDTLEDCVMNIEELKDELCLIIVTTTDSGREKWDTPTSKVGVAKVEKLRKDRYSALIMANMVARQSKKETPFATYCTTGGFAEHMDPDDLQSKDYYNGPLWWDSSIIDHL